MTEALGGRTQSLSPGMMPWGKGSTANPHCIVTRVETNLDSVISVLLLKKLCYDPDFNTSNQRNTVRIAKSPPHKKKTKKLKRSLAMISEN